MIFPLLLAVLYVLSVFVTVRGMRTAPFGFQNAFGFRRFGEDDLPVINR